MDFSQPKGIRRKKLQCPFTWSTPVLSEPEYLREKDILALAGDIWALVLKKLFLAYQCLMREDVESSKRLLVDCYIPLLDVKGFAKCDSDLINEYRIALKHVIDSTWAFVCCKSTSVKDLEPFLQTITPFDSMTDVQKSAVWGIRARLAYNDDGLRSSEIAIALNPTEGQWHFYKGFLLYHSRKSTRVATAEELKALEASHHLRVSPESMVAYAVSLTHQHRRTMDTKRGLRLLREALIRWPDNAYVNLECGVAFYRNHTKLEDLAHAERCLRTAVRLVSPDKCKAVLQALGSFLVHFKDKSEGKMYLHMANEMQM